MRASYITYVRYARQFLQLLKRVMSSKKYVKIFGTNLQNVLNVLADTVSQSLTIA